jgi:hypothetical protein
VGSAQHSTLVSAMGVTALLFAAGCGRAPVQREVIAPGTPDHLDGPALVLLPRTCIVDRRTASRHIAPSGPGSKTTLRLRQAVDATVGSVAGEASGTMDPSPVDSCKPPPDLSADPARLADVRASEDTLALMRARGAHQLVVVEIRTTLACMSGAGDTMVAHYGVASIAPTNAFPADDVCDDREIELSALVFRADGAAVWAGTREIEPGEPVEAALERLLQRIPVAIPGAGRRAGTKDLRDPFWPRNRPRVDRAGSGS